MVERNEGKSGRAPELRIAIAREVLQVMVASQREPLDIPERDFARKAVALADALLEALGEAQ